MKTAIVILNYNGKHYLEKFLPSVCRFSNLPNVEIIVADNASNDDSLAFLTKEFPQVKQIILSENYGFAGGYNKALQNIDSEYFILLNSDVEVSENWIEPIINYMDSHPQIAACQPKILSYNDKSKFEHAGAAGGYIDKLGYPFCRGRIFNETETDLGQYNDITEVFWASGACMFIRSKDFWEVGGFDARFFAHMEEIDLCWRINSRGKKIACVPQSTVYHVGGGTLTVESPRKTYLNFRNNLLMLYKNLPQENLNRILFTRMVLDGMAAMQFLVHGKIANIKSIWNAHFDFRKLKPDFTKNRMENISKENTKTISSILNKSIVLQAFVYKKKKYTDINWQ